MALANYRCASDALGLCAKRINCLRRLRHGSSRPSGIPPQPDPDPCSRGRLKYWPHPFEVAAQQFGTNDGVNPARQVKQSPHRKEDPKLGHPVIRAQKRDSVADQPDSECGIKNREERVVYAGIRFDECAEALARCWINGTGIGGPPVSVDSEN